MRPDQHKKKRSAQYKKKHGIQKDTGTKEKGKQQRREEKSKVEEQNSTTVTNTPKAEHKFTPVAANEVTPSFSRRKIESNWDRYEGLPDVDEEETITAKGVDFKRLLSETGHAEAQFRFRDEQSWEEEGAANNEAGIKFLSVDIDALGHHIKSIPVPERLGISRTLFENALLTKLDNEAKDESSNRTHSMLSNGDMLHIPNNDDKLPVQSRLDQDTSNDIDSIAKNAEDKIGGRTQVQQTDLHTTNKQNNFRTSDLNTNTAHLKESIKISAQTVGKVGYEASTAVQNLPDDITLDSGGGDGVKSTGDDNADDDLDFLLSLENPVQVKGQSAMSDVKEEKEESETLSSRPLETQDDQQSSMVEKACHSEVESPVKTGTDDLEDWLDDMLDD